MSEARTPLKVARDDLHTVASYLGLLGLLGAFVGVVVLGLWLARGTGSPALPAGIFLVACLVVTLAAGLIREDPWARRAFLVLVPLALLAATVAAALEMAPRRLEEVGGAVLALLVAWVKVGLGVRALRRPDVAALFLRPREGRATWREVGASFLGVAAAIGLFVVFAGTTAGVLLTRVALRPTMGIPELLLTGVGAVASGLVASVGLGLGLGLAHRRRARRALTHEVVARVQALRLEGRTLLEIRDHEAQAGRPLAPWLIKEALSGLPRRLAPTTPAGPPAAMTAEDRGSVAPP